MLMRAALLFLALSLPVLADEAAPPTAPSGEEAASLQSFAVAHPECGEWSDGCAVCKRDATGAHCSLPGIACLPAADVVCKAP